MKYRLLTPGPTPVPEETLLELARPIPFHRSNEFRSWHKEVHDGLQQVYATTSPVLTLTSSGTGGLEAALVNVAPPGKKAIILSAGRFGERWTHIAQAFGIDPIIVSVPYGKAVAPEQLERALAEHPDAAAVCSTLSETSTGVSHDIEAFGKIVAGTPAVLLVDAISGLGAVECRTDTWQIDICCTGSQKALMMPPGLAFVAVSGKAWRVIDANRERRTFYFDLKKARKSLETFDTPYTPAHILIRAMRLSLKRLLADGIEAVWRRQTMLAEGARAGIRALGLAIFPERPNTALTVASMPTGIDSTVLLGRLEKRFGLKIADGQGTLKGKILRLSHMGYVDQFDLLAALSGIEIVLKEMGHPVEVGRSLEAAQEVFARSSEHAEVDRSPAR